MTPREHAPGDRTRTVEIPDRTARDIEERISGTEFESIDGYVAFALEQLLRELDRAAEGDARTDAEPGRETTVGAADGGGTDESVSDRLESLGYL